MNFEKLHHYAQIWIPKLNSITGYVLVVLLWGPHAAQECVTSACNGPFFISPMLSAFIMPNWLIDMSLKGWLLQVLGSVPLVILVWLLAAISRKKLGTLLSLNALRWTIMWYAILIYYNIVFWSTLGREILLPYFMFIHS
jgi:hypothetical protein